MNEFTMNLIERQHTEEVLGFDPTQVEEGSFIIDITPEQAKYILRYHNNDNRKLCPNQVNKIADSVKVNGWVFDGNPIVFNTEGLVGQIIDESKFYEVLLLTDISHSLPIKLNSSEFFCNAKGSGRSEYIICT